MKQMQILLEAHCADDHAQPQPRYALARLTPRYARLVLEKIEKIGELKRLPGFDDLHRMEFFTAPVCWIGEGANFFAGPDPDIEATEERVFAVLDQLWGEVADDEGSDGRGIVIPEEKSLPDHEIDKVRISVETICEEVVEDGVRFNGYLKNSSTLVETALITREFLESLIVSASPSDS